MSIISGVIIGETSLALKCAQLLLEQHHSLLGICTQSTKIKTWCISNNINYFSSPNELKEKISGKSFDYLFSIVNSEILHADILESAGKFAINYHDGLLPKYAGVHASSWAILNSERKHGISWHIIEEGIDTGDILKQSYVTIDSDETSLSLNIKCYTAAIEGFRKLIEELAKDNYTRLKQDLTQRTYFSLNQKPPRNGMISWNKTAEDIYREYRVMKFGNYDNSFSSLKFAIKQNVFIVLELAILNTKSGDIPGTIIDISDSGIQITTKTFDISLLKLTDLTGVPIKLKEIVKKYNLHFRYVAPELNPRVASLFQKESEEISRFEKYWKHQLSNAINYTKLPFFNYDSISNKQKTIYLNISCELNQYDRQHFLFTIILIYLARINNVWDFTVALTNKFDNSFAQIQFLFATLLPFNIKLDANATFADAYNNVINLLKKSYKNKGYLCDIVARYPELHHIEKLNKAIKFLLVDDINNTTICYDPGITIIISRKNQPIKLIANELKDIEEQQRFIDYLEKINTHLEALIHSICDNDLCQLKFLRILTECEAQQQLLSFNNYVSNYPKNKNLATIFTEQAEATPNQIAVIFNDAKLTYEELERRANIVANYLINIGIKGSDNIAIYMHRSLDAIIGILGIIKIGAAYVPLDPVYSQTRLQYIVNDCGCRFCLTTANLYLECSAILPSIKVIRISDVENSGNPQELIYSINPLDVAYIMYTSGTTGTPKGSRIPHRGIVRLVKNINYIEFKSGDKIAHAASMAFDASTFEIWGALLNGLTLVIIPQNCLLDLSELSLLLDKYPVNIAWLTSSLFNEIVTTNCSVLSSIKYLLIGGEKLNPTKVHKFYSENSTSTLINGYGPTENTTFTTFFVIPRTWPKHKSIPLGKPISNTTTYVLDNNLQLMPIGSIGELFVGGDGLAIDYLNNEALTNEKFVTQILNKIPTRLYKTGDLVRWLPNGNLDYIGRIDKQIKIRGFRIELSEIEYLIEKYDAIKQCAVFLKVINGFKYLIAYIVTSNKNNFNDAELMDFLKAYLPEYALPAAIITLDEIPLTPNNKIDEQALPMPDFVTESKDGLPTTSTEKILIEVFQTVLNLKYLTINNNFFSLGGDSIIAIQVVAKARDLGLFFTATQLFSYPVIKDLASVITTGYQQNNATKPYEITADAILLTPIQKWFFEQAYNEVNHFNQVLLLKLTRDINFSILEKAINYLYEHHDTLRIYFSHSSNSWQQFYGQHTPLLKLIEQIEVVDHESINEVVSRKVQTANEEIKITSPPLLKVIFFKCVKSLPYLAIVAHHLIVDGVSWRVLVDDLIRFYSIFEKGEQLTFPRKTSSYTDWSKELRNFAKSDSLLAEKDYWYQVTKHNFLLPKDHVVKHLTKESSSQSIYGSLTNIQTKKIIEIAKTLHVHTNELILAAFATSLCKWSQQKHLYLNLEGHGRENISKNIDLSKTVGWFTSIFPAFFDFNSIQDEISINNILPLIKQQLRLVPNKGIGYGILRYLSEQNEIINRLEQQDNSEISFNYLGNIDASFNHEWFIVTNEPIALFSGSNNTNKYALDVTAWISQECLHFKWHYSNEQYNGATIKKLSRGCINSLLYLLSKHDSKNNYFNLIPSDFPLVNITQDQLDDLFNRDPYIDNILPLSPTQSGMLFHTLRNPDSEVYCTQVYWQHNGSLDCNLMKKSWFALLVKHPILRAKYCWLGLPEPLQVITHQTHFSIQFHDWSSKKQQRAELQKFLHHDCFKKFNLNKSPLIRVAIIKLSDCQYVVIWSHHHILLDGWSVGIVINDLYSTYSRLLVEHQPIITKAKAVFHDYLYWLKNKPDDNDKAFWQNYLDNAAFNNNFIIGNKVYNDTASIDYKSLEKTINTKFSRAIRSFAKKHNLTLNTVFQTACSLLLNKYSDNNDIIFGVTVTARPEKIPYIQEVVGVCINSLPFRIKIEESNSLLFYLNETQKNMVLINSHCCTSLVDIKNWIKSIHELFNILFVFENYDIEVSHQAVSNIAINDYTNYPLAIYVFPHDSIKLKIVYDAKLFSRGFIANFLKNFALVLDKILPNPNISVRDLEIPDGDEKQKLLAFGTGPVKSYPQKSITELFTHTVSKYTNKIAVTYRDKSISYNELNIISNRLTNHLLAHGVIRGSLVLILLNRGISAIVSLLAVVKAGAVYVPLDFSYPAERLKFVLRDTNAKFIITTKNISSDLARLLNDGNRIVFQLDDEFSGVNNYSEKLEYISSYHDDLMYVMYTSGSTGTPKGVMVKQNSVVNVLYDIFERLHITNSDVFFSVTNITFDISVLEIFGSLLFGLQLIIADRDELIDDCKLKQQIYSNKVTAIQATPSLWQILASSKLDKNSKLKILVGGEKLSRELAERLLKITDIVWNVYGPTETTIWSMIEKISKNKKRIDIGEPLANTNVYVLNGKKNLVPLEVIGELYISGTGVAKGYLNRPDLTSLKFTENTITNDNTMMYRTGDLVKMWPDGSLEFVDRIDDQVKLHGHRIELGEISSILLKYQGIQDCITIVNSYNNEQVLTSYYIKEPIATVTPIDLKGFLHHHLPPYMVPSVFIEVKSFPLNNSGKINKHVLEKLFIDFHHRSIIKEGSVSSFTEKEHQLVTIWQEILHVPVTNKSTDFFSLGGNSLLTLKLLTNIKKVFNVDLAIHDIITASRFAELFSLICAKNSRIKHKVQQNLSEVSPIVQLSKYGSRQPIFFIHPVGGSVFWFASLAKYLRVDHPLYGIYDPGIEKKQLLFDSLENMATFYLKCIKKIQKKGPYLIGGASFGATAAVEITRQLEQAGDTVALVSLFDGWAIYPEEIQSRKFLERNMWRQYKEIKTKLKLQDINQELAQPIIDIHLHRNKMLNNYTQPCISSNVLLLKAKEIMPVFAHTTSTTNYWDRTIKSLTILEVPGNHESMFYPPNVEYLAKIYSDFLAKNI